MATFPHPQQTDCKFSDQDRAGSNSHAPGTAYLPKSANFHKIRGFQVSINTTEMIRQHTVEDMSFAVLGFSGRIKDDNGSMNVISRAEFKNDRVCPRSNSHPEICH